ncbi:hypothetical protein LTR37_016910 [Vermiconidia calcicola]|uniref:Uncharacterized protein n=1 Tax=Vermiconidia calcicola TaxID=1690605 RepID=A0ACC3MLN2_9PEZI|nr:hypothetical protein LTR37_016910 [Vermiconidia calcicola]
MASHLKNIALVGASGNAGGAALKALLAANRFNITIISRADSSATFPEDASITVKKGDYKDPSFLQSAFSGQDAAMLALGFMAMDTQPALIEAAAKAGVKYILPTEYAADGQSKELTENLPPIAQKAEGRSQIEEMGAKWIAIVTNPWTEFSLAYGVSTFGIDVKEKKAVLWEDAGKFNTTSREQVGRGIAAVLSLPIENKEDESASLQHYANNFVYISSFLVTQRQLFDSVLRATGTKEADWSVEESKIWGDEGRVADAQQKMAQGNFMAMGGLMYGFYMSGDKGGNYEEKAKKDREVLGLKEENLDAVVKEFVNSA